MTAHSEHEDAYEDAEEYVSMQEFCASMDEAAAIVEEKDKRIADLEERATQAEIRLDDKKRESGRLNWHCENYERELTAKQKLLEEVEEFALSVKRYCDVEVPLSPFYDAVKIIERLRSSREPAKEGD